MNGFEVAVGSVPGTDHTRPGKPVWRNNQDAFDFVSGSNFLIGVVCDGCGGANAGDNYSELGARLGARLVAKVCQEFLSLSEDLERNAEVFLEAVAKRVTDDLRVIAETVTSGVDERDAFAFKYLQFTIIGFVMTEETTLVFSFGDGVYAVNGDVSVIPAFASNEPPYIVFRFARAMIPDELLKFEVRALLPTAKVTSLLIGSDGVADLIRASDSPMPVSKSVLGPLSQFWEDDRYVKNPDTIRRRLAMANHEHADGGLVKGGLLHDDTTLLVARRI